MDNEDAGSINFVKGVYDVTPRNKHYTIIDLEYWIAVS